MIKKCNKFRLFLNKEIISHLNLIIINKKEIVEYFSNPFRVILIVIFTILFLPHVFIMVKDIALIAAYEVDPGSIIDSILSLYKNSYNMNAGYHSQYYGWTYFSINFLLLLPIYLAKLVNIVQDDYFFFVAIRLLFFFIGLGSVLIFFDIIKKTLKNSFYSFLGTILYISSPITFRFFYFLHPETTGLLFLFLGVLCLLKFIEGFSEDYRWYSYGLLSLVLSVLSKQIFIFLAFPVLFLFILFYTRHHQKKIISFLISKQFAQVFLFTVVFSIFVFFIINPYAFFQPKEFLTNQANLFFGHTKSSQSFIEVITLWMNIISDNHVISISFILFPFLILYKVLKFSDGTTGKILFLVNIISSIFFVVLISISSQKMIYNGYFAPVYPFFIINLLGISIFVFRQSKIKLIKVFLTLLFSYFYLFLLIGSFSVSIPTGFNRLMYQNSVNYKVFNYIEEEIPKGSKIAHDHFIGIPSDKDLKGCHFWQGCGTDYIEEFNPDYVIFNEKWEFNNEQTQGTIQLLTYVKKHKFILIDSIQGITNDINGEIIEVSVYEKWSPEN